MDEVRRDHVRERAPLVVRLSHETDVAEPEIAEPTVDQLRRGARRARPEITCVDERDDKSLAGCMCGGRGTDDSTADDEQVERAGRELLE